MVSYRATSSLDVVELPEGAVLLRSDLGSCRIEGESARLLAAEVLPRLSDWTAFEDLAGRLVGYDLQQVQALLDQLATSRLLLKSGKLPKRSVSGARFLAELGLDEAAAARQLSQVRLAIVGNTNVAALLQQALADFGLERLTLLGRPSSGENGPGCAELSKQALFETAEQVDLILIAVDRAMLAARHWANQAALKTGCPAMFIDVAALEAFVGPTVLPGESGCYTCFRMRHLATSDTFVEVMAHERHLDEARDQGFERPAFPGLAEMAAGAAATEAVRLLFPPLSPSLANAVLRIDPVAPAIERHEVLRQPDCPNCAGINKAVRKLGTT